MSQEKEAYTIQEAAELLQVDYNTIRRAVAEQRIRSFRFSQKMIRIPREEIERFSNELVYRVSEAAFLLGISQAALRKLISSGQVSARRLSPKGPWRIPKQEVNRILGVSLPKNDKNAVLESV